MCILQSVLYAGFSLCYVKSLGCLVCSMLRLGLAAKAARVVLMSHAQGRPIRAQGGPTRGGILLNALSALLGRVHSFTPAPSSALITTHK